MIKHNWKYLTSEQVNGIIEDVYEEITHGDPDKRWKVNTIEVATIAFKRCQKIEQKLSMEEIL